MTVIALVISKLASSATSTLFLPSKLSAPEEPDPGVSVVQTGRLSIVEGRRVPLLPPLESAAVVPV